MLFRSCALANVPRRWKPVSSVCICNAPMSRERRRWGKCIKPWDVINWRSVTTCRLWLSNSALSFMRSESGVPWMSCPGVASRNPIYLHAATGQRKQQVSGAEEKNDRGTGSFVLAYGCNYQDLEYCLILSLRTGYQFGELERVCVIEKSCFVNSAIKRIRSCTPWPR